MRDHYRMVSWWLRKDDLPWPNRKSEEKFRRRAACMAREGVNAAIIFGAHFRWDFMPPGASTRGKHTATTARC